MKKDVDGFQIIDEATHMTETAKANGYEIKSNGSKTWMVMSDEDCIFATDTERKAKNYLARTLRDAGLIK